MSTAPLAELMESNTRSRFAVLETASKHPGKCAVCGAPNKPVLDIGTNIPQYGWVMLCFECVSEAGLRIGLIHPDELERESLQAGQSVLEYLTARNLRVVSDEFYNNVSLAFGSFATSSDDILSDLFVGLDNARPAPAQGEFQFDGGDSGESNPEPDGNDDPFKLGTSETSA